MLTRALLTYFEFYENEVECQYQIHTATNIPGVD